MFVNTGQEFDGSDAGARPDEAISWGKIKSTATPVKVCVDVGVVYIVTGSYMYRSTQMLLWSSLCLLLKLLPDTPVLNSVMVFINVLLL